MTGIDIFVAILAAFFVGFGVCMFIVWISEIRGKE